MSGVKKLDSGWNFSGPVGVVEDIKISAADLGQDGAGTITVSFSDDANGFDLTLTPNTDNLASGITWTCGAPEEFHKYVPANCRNAPNEPEEP